MLECFLFLLSLGGILRWTFFPRGTWGVGRFQGSRGPAPCCSRDLAVTLAENIHMLRPSIMPSKRTEPATPPLSRQAMCRRGDRNRQRSAAQRIASTRFEAPLNAHPEHVGHDIMLNGLLCGADSCRFQ